MKLLNGEVLGASQALEILSEKDFPIKVSYGLVTLIDKMANQVAIIDKLRTELIKKYGTEEKNGNIAIAPNTPKMVKFMDEFNTLLSQEIEVDFEPVTLPFEIDGASYNIEPKILRSLGKFINME